MNNYFKFFLFLVSLSGLHAEDLPWENFCGVVVMTRSEGEGGVVEEKSLKQTNSRTGNVSYYTPVIDNSNREEAEIVALRSYQSDALEDMLVGKKYCVTGIRGAESPIDSHLRNFVTNFHSVTPLTD